MRKIVLFSSILFLLMPALSMAMEQQLGNEMQVNALQQNGAGVNQAPVGGDPNEEYFQRRLEYYRRAIETSNCIRYAMQCAFYCYTIVGCNDE
jgi:hypothetical protein